MALELSPSAPETRPHPPLPLSIRRLRRLVGRTGACVTGAFFPTPIGRWLHERLRSTLEISVLEVALGSAESALDWPTIAFLSDLHAGHYMTAQDLEGLARLVATLDPDLVCLGGDLINTRLSELVHLDRALRHLRAPLGLYAVPGNHDFERPGELDERWTEHLEARGVRVLRNRGQRLRHRGRSFWLCGVDDLTEGEPDLGAALRGRIAGEPAILLSHHPDLFREASAQDVDLQLSGHTHGGQIRLFGWTPYKHSRCGYEQGLYGRGRSRLFVGRGAGVSLFPLRMGTRAEITLLRPRSG